MKIIRDRAGKVLYQAEVATLRDAVVRAVVEKVSLARANLDGANLDGASLDGANLDGARMAQVQIDYAAKQGARNVPTTPVSSTPAASVTETTQATSSDHEARRRARIASRAESARWYRERHPEVPVVADLDVKVRDAISAPGHELNMGDWHSCETTHCRGGWAIHLAGKAGYELEEKVGVQQAARMIYRASTGRSPHFYATTERARADIERCAAEAQK